MNKENLPDFYTGAPIDPADLRFRDAFLSELWETLRSKHVLLTAPRRTGKTSVMDHLRDFPVDGYSVVSINVQDLSHPADFFQTLLDAFHDAHPQLVRDSLARGWELLGKALALRPNDPRILQRIATIAGTKTANQFRSRPGKLAVDLITHRNNATTETSNG